MYLTSSCPYLPEDDDSKVMQTAYQIYTKEKQFPDAMKVALMMNDEVRLLAKQARFTEKDCSSNMHHAAALDGNGIQGDSTCFVVLQELVKETFASCGDPLVQKQLGYLLARQGDSCSPQVQPSVPCTSDDSMTALSGLTCLWEARQANCAACSGWALHTVLKRRVSNPAACRDCAESGGRGEWDAELAGETGPRAAD